MIKKRVVNGVLVGLSSGITLALGYAFPTVKSNFFLVVLIFLGLTVVFLLISHFITGLTTGRK